MSRILDIHCPSCRSKQLSTSENSNGRLTLTCIACGHSFKAIDSDETPKHTVQQKPTPVDVPAEKGSGVELPDFNQFNQKLIEITQASGLVSAIKYCKDITGWSLPKCKEHVERLMKDQTGFLYTEEQTNPVTLPGSDILDQQIIEIARTQGKLHAVKHYKERTGKGLKESLDYVDKLVPPGAYKKVEGCFIATACYGDYDAAEVIVLRNYRDSILLKNAVGKVFVRFYYVISPPLAYLIRDKGWLKQLIRKYLLQPLVNRLQQPIISPGTYKSN